MRPALAASAAVLFASASIALGAPSVDPAQGEAVIRRCASIYNEPVDGKSHPCACAFDHAKTEAYAGHEARTTGRAARRRYAFFPR